MYEFKSCEMDMMFLLKDGRETKNLYDKKYNCFYVMVKNKNTEKTKMFKTKYFYDDEFLSKILIFLDKKADYKNKDKLDAILYEIHEENMAKCITVLSTP